MHYQSPDPSLSRPVCFGDHTEPRTETLSDVTCLICRRLATEDTGPLARLLLAVRESEGTFPPLEQCDRCRPPVPHGLPLADEILAVIATLNRVLPAAHELQSPVAVDIWSFKLDLPRVAAALLGACDRCITFHDPLVVMHRLYERALRTLT